MNLWRFGLVDKGIVYDSQVARDGQCPPHVESLRMCIRDFSYPLPGFSTSCTLESLLAHVAAHPDTTDQRVRLAKETQQEAIRLKGNGFSESAWSAFFNKQFFHRLDTCTLSSNPESRVSSRSHFYYDAIVSEGDQPWDVFRRGSDDYQLVHCPKPDAVFYLPVYDTNSTIPINSSVAFRNTHWQQAPNASMVEPFSWTTLNNLNMHGGLEPCPRRLCDNKTRIKSGSQLRCYPWLIAEYKKAHTREADSKRAGEIVCCQANNATACALQLNRQLAKYASPLANEGHVLPLPAVTTNGSNVTLWIAYYAKDVKECPRFGFLYSRDGVISDAYIMQAVWKGDMTNLEDIFAFQMALENIYTWAIRVFKPLVASYINQWVTVHLQQSEPAALPHVLKQVENYRTVVPMVNSLLREYQTLGFESRGNADGVDPLHFGLVLNQLIGSNHKNLLEEIGRIMTEKLQLLVGSPGLPLTVWTSQQPSERGQSRRGSTAGAENRNTARGSPDDASDIYSPGNSDGEGSQTTRASQTAIHQANLKRSTTSNQNIFFERRKSVSSDTQRTSDAGVTPEGTPGIRCSTPIDLTEDGTDITTPTADTGTTSGSLFGTPSTTASTTASTTPSIASNEVPTSSPKATPGVVQTTRPRTQRSTSPGPVDEDSTNSTGTTISPGLSDKFSP